MTYISLELEDDGTALVLSAERAGSCSLVLEAMKIPFRLERLRNGWHLLVPPKQIDRAQREIRLYEWENADWPPPPPPSLTLFDNSLATLCILLLLATFHNITLLEMNPSGSDWSTLGNAYAGKIRHGEWWRTITALTLHADGLHLFGNLAIGWIFVDRLCRQFGEGLGWSLILSSGILGNLGNAFLQPYHHQAIGASTAIFGTVGILAGWTLLRYRRTLWRHWAIPLSGALGLLALLGTGGDNTDLGAHLLGFGFGVPIGLATAWHFRRWGSPSPTTQRILAFLTAASVLAAWGVALFQAA